MLLHKLPQDAEPSSPRPAQRKKPEELGLELSCHVLRLPLKLVTRLVLAEIISLHITGARGCDASDQHFADRLSVSLGTATSSVGELFRALLIDKDVDKAAGFYRVLRPRFTAIEAAAQLNPYPQRRSRYPTPKIGVGTAAELPGVPTPRIEVGYPKIWGSPTPRIEVALPQELRTNTITLNTSVKTSLTPQEVSAEAELSEKKEPQVIAKIPAPAAKKKSPAAQKVTEQRQARQLPQGCPFHDLVNEDGLASIVQQLAQPLTEAQALRLCDEYHEAEVRKVLLAMAAYKPLLKNGVSANLTARVWLDKRPEAHKSNHHANSPTSSAHSQPAPRGSFARPINGHKPSANAGQLARSLNSHLRRGRAGEGSN